MDSIKIAANNGESNISIGWKVLLDWSCWDVWTKFSNSNCQTKLKGDILYISGDLLFYSIGKKKWVMHINERMQEMARMLMRWSDVSEKVHWPLICVLLLLSCSWLDVSCSFSQTHSNWMRSSCYRWGVEGILLVNIVRVRACVCHI